MGYLIDTERKMKIAGLKIFFLVQFVAANPNYDSRRECEKLVDCQDFSGWSWPSCLVRGIQTFDLKFHPCRLLLAECNNEPIYPGKCKKEGLGMDIIISVESEFGICSMEYCNNVGICFYEYLDTTIYKCICPFGYEGELCERKITKESHFFS